MVCYGGVLSYVFDRADPGAGRVAARHQGRRTRAAERHVTPGNLTPHLRWYARSRPAPGAGVVDKLFATHDQIGVVAGGHLFRYYTWASLQILLERHRRTILDAAAANFLAIGNNEELLEELIQGPRSDLWDAYLARKVEGCRRPDAIDAGTHIIAVVQKMPTPSDVVRRPWLGDHAELRDDAELAHQAEVVVVAPMLGNPTVGHTHDVDAGERDGAAGRQDAEEVALVGPVKRDGSGHRGNGESGSA